jgi:thiamine-monophosphate kinase
MMNAIAENRLINLLAERFRRSPLQANGLHESDAELLRIGPSTYLAATTDTLAEEIACGLYRDPYLIGWMAVMASMSDLAAVGARPIGMLISELIPRDASEMYLRSLQQGIQDACAKCETYIAGGDTNAGAQLSITGCAFGVVRGSRTPLGRLGCLPGDILFATGPLGTGNAFALAQFIGGTGIAFRPVARLREGRLISSLASSRMDTSDGVLATLDQLMRLNGTGFDLDDGWERSCSPEALAVAAAHGVPPWLLLAGEHGEFELLFTLPEAREEQLLEHLAGTSCAPLRIGRVTTEPVITMPIRSERTPIDTARIRNIGNDHYGDVETYIAELMTIDDELQKGVHHVHA